MANLRDILRQVGFTGNALNIAYAVAMAESGGNARAFNGNRKTGDRSFGLFQINMLGGMGPERRRQFGLSADDDLYDAVTNARVAYRMSKGGTDWTPWSAYNNNTYRRFLTGGNTAVRNVGSASPAAQALEPEQQAPPEKPDIIGSGLGQDFAPGASSFTSRPKDITANQVKQQAAATPGAAVPVRTGSTSVRDKIISAAMGVLGTPYSWGGGSTKGPTRGILYAGRDGRGTVGFDCSSLAMYAFAQAGISVPRTGRPQLARGTRAPISSLRPGDLVGFGDGYHMAIYIGNGQIIESPRSGLTVRVRKLGSRENAWGVRLNLPGD